MPLAEIGPGPFASHFRHDPPPDNRHPATKVVVAGILRGKFDCGLPERRQFLVDSKSVKDNLSGTISRFIPIKNEADRSARLDRDHIGVVTTLDQNLNFLNAIADGIVREVRPLGTQEIPEFASDQSNTECHNEGVNKAHLSS